MATYGVGPSASRTNVGPNINMDAKLQADGKVYNDGVLVFDPSVDMFEQIAPDGALGGSLGSAVSTAVVVTLPGGVTRAVYTVPKANLTTFLINWFDDTIDNSKTLTGGISVGGAAADAATTVTATQDATNVTIQYDFATDIGDDQAAFDTGGSSATVAQADGETVTITRAAA